MAPPGHRHLRRPDGGGCASYEAAISAGDMASLRALISAPGSEVDQEKLQIGFHIASILSAGAEAAAAN